MSSSSTSTIPAVFICPISCCLMSDPVVDREGNSYDRPSIEAWLANNKTSPLTRTPLAIEHLVSNRALKESIEEWKKEHPDVDTSSTTTTTASINQIMLTEQLQTLAVKDTHALSVNAQLIDGAIYLELSPPGTDSSSSSSSASSSSSSSSSSSPSRTPSDVVCVIDVSGSMGSEVSSSSGEQTGLSQLDLVKHAMKTIISALTSADRLSIVAFHNSASTLLPLTSMNDGGKRSAQTQVDALDADGGTNIWEGLRTALEILDKHQSLRNQSIFLLSDGCSTEPPRGFIQTLKRHLAQRPYHGSIHTFGFGYDVDSNVLLGLAKEGNGAYAFIPDGGMVGTVFISAISGVLTTVSQSISLRFSFTSSSSSDQSSSRSTLSTVSDASVLFESCFDSSTDAPNHSAVSVSAHVPVSSVLLGISRTVILKLSPAALQLIAANFSLSLVLDYVNVLDNKQVSQPVQIVQGVSADVDVKKRNHQLRHQAVSVIRHALKTHSTDNAAAQATVNDFIKALNSISPSDKFVTDLIGDFTSQVQPAITRSDYFTKWGRHYLPSLACAHSLQLCNNFKDAAVQHYVSKPFTELRDLLDDIFCKLPAPTPSVNRYGGISRGSANSPSSSSSASSSSSISMRSFHDANGACIAGSTRVCVQRKSSSSSSLSWMYARDICPGTVLSNGAVVEMVLRTNMSVKDVISSTSIAVTELNGILITPYHPIMLSRRNDSEAEADNESWVFPHTVNGAVTKRVPCDVVYSYVLDRKHTMPLLDNDNNKISMITLGHGRRDVKILKHDYLGTMKIVNDMRLMQRSGFVDISPCDILRHADTGRICGLDRSNLITEL